jgi:hypothetical protein
VASSLGYIGPSYDSAWIILIKSSFQTQLLVPVGTAIFETMWNSAPFAFDFDYGATLMGFLAYKVALLTVLYDEVRKMIISTNDVTLESEDDIKDV